MGLTVLLGTVRPPCPRLAGGQRQSAGRLQIIYGGKAHPRDDEGKRVTQQIVQARDSLGPDVRIVYLENYDWELGCLLTAGVDVWLNTPLQRMVQPYVVKAYFE